MTQSPAKLIEIETGRYLPSHIASMTENAAKTPI